ncbi:hypothetical protein ANO11243_063360 [Dothideomycetidae sp. 11243]|nr:hypothetical protein ANO11243_063360 [fungal sp. No.11243]
MLALPTRDVKNGASAFGTYTANDGKLYDVTCNYNLDGSYGNIVAFFQNIASLPACAEQCESFNAGNPQKTCEAVVYYRDAENNPAPYGAAGDCFLLSTSTGGTNNAATGVDSAVSATSCDPTPYETTDYARYQINCNTNINGDGGNILTTTFANSIRTCADACSAYSGCVDVTWYREDAPDGPAGTCFLLSGHGATQDNADSRVDSAVQIAPAPPMCSSPGPSTTGTYTADDGNVYDVTCNYNLDGSHGNIVRLVQNIASLPACVEQCESYNANSPATSCEAVVWYRIQETPDPLNGAAGDCFLLSSTDYTNGDANGVDSAIYQPRQLSRKELEEKAHRALRMLEI